MKITGQAQWDAWQAKLPPPVEVVRPGLWSVPVQIPDNPLRYVLTYVFEVAGGVVLVDTGWPVEIAWQALVRGVEQTGHSITDVRGVLVTHAHADHHGLAGRIREQSGAWVAMHADDAAAMRSYLARDADAPAHDVRWLVARGATAIEAADMVGPLDANALSVPMVVPDRIVADGELVLDGRWRLRAFWTPGHTPGHLCFHEERASLMLSGDHVLPRITPNISVQPGQLPNPLQLYLESLEKIARFEADEVLPAHEYRFAGLAQRCSDLLRHHDDRLAEVLAAVKANPAATTWEIAQQLSWSRPWAAIVHFPRRAALGETLAHLILLASRGQVRSTGADVDRWV